jgi:hypothetical protein
MEIGFGFDVFLNNETLTRGEKLGKREKAFGDLYFFNARESLTPVFSRESANGGIHCNRIKSQKRPRCFAFSLRTLGQKGESLQLHNERLQ